MSTHLRHTAIKRGNQSSKVLPNTEGIKSDLNGNILNYRRDGKIKGTEKTAEGKLHTANKVCFERGRMEKEGLKRVHHPGRINIPENRGESEMFHHDALAYGTRPVSA